MTKEPISLVTLVLQTFPKTDIDDADETFHSREAATGKGRKVERRWLSKVTKQSWDTDRPRQQIDN